MDTSERHTTFRWRIEQKPEGGFIARSADSPDTLEGTTREEIEAKMREKLAAVLGPEIAAKVDFHHTGAPQVHVEKKISVRWNKNVQPPGGGRSVPAVIDAGTLGYPLKSLKELPAGEYYVQALVNVYTEFHRADGHTIWAHMDQWEGQQFNKSPGNIYSAVQKVHLDPKAGYDVKLSLDTLIPPVEVPADTEWVKHIKIQSAMLTKFWGQPIYLGATVLLPKGYDTHPKVDYPVIYEQGHFSLRPPLGFSTTPPTPAELKRAGIYAGFLNRGYDLYKNWTTDNFPRMIVVTFQHPTPYFDDSYAVNSANVGPYGDAITKELIPYIEKKFHGIGQQWARATYGGSTGGWEALASQVFYPTFYNGAWAFCPDPVDFHRYQIVDIYDDKNAYWLQGPFGRVPRPDMRDPDGTIVSTMESSNQWERVLGSHGRSTQQWGIWQAVFGPVGSDGYPKPIWNPATGVIDHQVAEYWREHYDIEHILQSQWKTLGPHLVGKIHVSVGTMDTWYLNLAVKRLQKFLDHTNNPYFAGSFEYGPGQPHCYTGKPNLPARIGGLSATARVLRAAAQRLPDTAPGGAEISRPHLGHTGRIRNKGREQCPYPYHHGAQHAP